MKLLAALLLLGAGLFAGAGYAQNWVVFAPPEGDFRVIFPAPPGQTTGADGSVVFKATFENEENSVDYLVHRLPPGVPRIDDARAELQRRLQARVGEDIGVRYVHEEDSSPDWERYVFRYRRAVSIHRLVGTPGRYYELQVLMPRGRVGVAMHSARDFFNSFQATGLSLPGLGVAVAQRLEAWCQTRTDPFTRAFCEYSVCLQPGSEKYPHCASLLRR
jgi:hypothetical protein